MLFPTLSFGLFFLTVFALAWAARPWPALRMGVLVAASYVFYGWWDWRFCFLLFASTALNWAAGLWLHRERDRTRRKRILAGAIAVNLLVLGVFKYHGFFLGELNGLLLALGLGAEIPLLSLALPIAISFFTFHGISYVVDLHRGQIERPASLLEMLLYISFFPQLVAGPIVRAAHFLPQLRAPADPDDIRARRAFLLILVGLFKKVVVANYLATELVDQAFLDPARLNGPQLLVATYGYAVQIYCDFSAYTDIATGCAALLGYRFPQNFDQPYRAMGLRDFWRRWHIALSSWLRDYLYVPLGGNRSGGWRNGRNLALTMLLGGLWHGAAWTFVLWGALHGLALAVEHALWRDAAPRRPWQRWAAIAATFHFVCLCWIFFRAPDLGRALEFLAGFARWESALPGPSPFVLALVAGGLAAQFLPPARLAIAERWVETWPLWALGAALGVAIVAIDGLGPAGVAPFIYFQF